MIKKLRESWILANVMLSSFIPFFVHVFRKAGHPSSDEDQLKRKLTLAASNSRHPTT